MFCCLISLFSLGWHGARSVMDWPRQREEAQLWASPADAGVSAKWEERRCKILGSGIANRGGCWRENPEGINRVLNFWSRPDPAFFSECGGLRWCADEHGTCDCPGGDVTYAAAKFSGNLPAAGHSEVVRGGTEPVKCWTGAGSPFATDPAPGSSKHCFCTPAPFAALARKYGGLDEKCSGDDDADSVYRLEAADPAAKARKLVGESAEDDAEELGTLADRSSSADDPGKASSEAVQQKWMLPDGRCDSASITNMFDADFPVFLPWALVEERLPPDSSEAGADGTASASREPRLRCAFSYGAAAASREEQDGAKQLYAKWSSLENATLPCYVRVGGWSADRGCAVALEKVTAFGAEDIAAREMAYLFGDIVAIVLSCLPVLIGVCLCMGPHVIVVRPTERGLLEDDSGSDTELQPPPARDSAQP